MYAVTGSTGQVGKAVVRTLIGQGKQVRALYRDEAKKSELQAMGAEPVLASVEDPAALEVAFRGVEGVFVMTPPFYRSHDPRNENEIALAALAHALRASHVTKAVLLSSVGAQHERGTGAILKLHDMEKELTSLNLCVASIRAAFFMENFKPIFEHAKQSGKLPVSLEPLDREIPMVATQDIGELAATLLVHGWPGQLTVELEGPRAYSMNDVAAAFSKIAGSPVRAEVIPPEGRQAFYESAGFTAASAATMVEMAEGFNNGLVDFEGGKAEHRRGTTTLEEVFSDA
jgi:NAD(P)H dehydrogenase (quinone)